MTVAHCAAFLCTPPPLPLPPVQVYTDRGGSALSSLLTKAFDPEAVFDLPAFFLDSSSNMRTLAHLLVIPFWKVTAHPKLVTVQMLTPSLGRIDVEGTLEFHPRFASLFPAALVVPEHLQLHGTWTIVAKGDDDKILSVTETLHNLPSLPLFLRRLVATGMVTAGSILGF